MFALLLMLCFVLHFLLRSVRPALPSLGSSAFLPPLPPPSRYQLWSRQGQSLVKSDAACRVDLRRRRMRWPTPKTRRTVSRCCRCSWACAMRLSRVAAVALSLGVVVYRVGEAANLGPYQYGGASSSGAFGAAAGGARTAHSTVSVVSGTVPVGVLRQWSAERLAVHELPEQVEVAVHGVTHAVRSGASSSRFDDPNDWAFGDQEDADSDPWDAGEPWNPEPEELCEQFQETQNGQNLGARFEALDEDIELTGRWDGSRRLSAMAEWEACPAIIEGIVELPSIEEEVGGFRTVEGWWVTDPLERERRQHAMMREQRLGIAGLKGVGSHGLVSGSLPPRRSCPCGTANLRHRQRLAQLPQESLPLEPQVEVQRPTQDSEEAVQMGGSSATRVDEASPTCGSSSSGASARRRRGKGRRRVANTEDGTVSIWTFNSSGAPQLRAAIKHCCKSGSDVPVALLCQEHHAGVEQMPDLQAQFRALGWKLAATKANDTSKGSRSAGVGVGTPNWVAAGLDDNMKVDCSPAESLGRIAVLWMQQVAPGGVVAVSCYLHDSEGSSGRNVELLSCALRTARKSGCPWILGLDAQQEPKDLLKWAAPMIDRAEGSVVAPCEPTHFPGVGQNRCLDYFILDRSLAEAVQGVETVAELRCFSKDADYTVAAKPHRAVRLRLNHKFRPMLLRTLKVPRSFPRNKPIGCAREPVTASTPAIDGLQLAEDRDGNLAAITETWGKVVGDIEDELCGICDLTGKSRRAHRGRQHEVAEAFRPSLPRRAAGPRGTMAQTEYATVWGANRLRELRALSEAYRHSGTHTPGQERQWTNLIRKLCSPTAPTMRSGSERWEEIASTLIRCWTKPAEATTALRVAHNWAEALLRRQTRLRTEKQSESWDRWKRKQAVAGGQGGALFHFLKRVEEDPEVVVRCFDGASAAPQAILDHDFQSWNSLWQKLCQHASAPWRHEVELSVPSPDLPPLGCVELRKAARTFTVTTGTGVDALVPTHYAWLSDGLLDNIGKLLGAIESSGCWPQQVMLSVIHLIPKLSGGKRPIGLLASIVRLWDRARKPTMDLWRSTCVREYDWMRKGRGAERSVWAQTLHEEAAASKGLSTASVFVDLVKAFEQVILGRVWGSGLKHGMLVPILRLALEACAFVRRLKYKGAVSEAAQTLTAILAGSGRATDLLYVALVDAVDEALVQHERMCTRTSLKCFMVVDDIRLAVQGSEEEVAEVLPCLAETLVEILEKDLNMEVSRDSDGFEGKTLAQTSSHNLDSKVKYALGRLGIKVRTKVKNLGIHFVTRRNRRATNVEAKKRYQVGLKRVQRAKKVGRRAHLQAFRSLLTPSFTFGASAVTCPTSIVKALRTQTARTFGPIEGRSTTVRLLLESSDVRHDVAIRTVMAWVNVVWEDLVELETMHSAWKHACACRASAPGKKRGALAGAAAYLEALGQIGWHAPSVHSVRTRRGHILYFGAEPAPEGAQLVDPSFVKVIASDEYESAVLVNSKLAEDIADLSGAHGYPRDDSHARALDGRSPGSSPHEGRNLEEEARAVIGWRRGRYEHSGDKPVPWLWPVKTVMRAARRRGLMKQAASLRALAEGAWPTQFKLYCQRRAEHMLCRCGAAVGTLRHKLAECSLSEDLRQRECPEWLQNSSRRGGWNPLFTRGVPARPRAPQTPSNIVWTESSSGEPVRTATGDLFTDGSSKGLYWRARRGGWSVVAVDGAGRWLWTKWGTLGGLNVNSFRAELQAILEVLQIAVPPVRIHTDNQDVVDGVQRGRGWCTRAKAAGADLWRKVFDRLEELASKGQVSVIKVKAHTSWVDLLSRRITPREQFGNWLADGAAKAATAASEAEAPTASFNEQLRTALAWTRWIARYATDWVEDIAPSPMPKQGSPAEGAWEYGDMYLRHEKWVVGQHALCRRCGISLPTHRGAARVSTQCAGAATGRAAAHATGNINYVWARFLLSKRQLEEKGGRQVSDAAPPRWIVDPQRLHELAASPAQVAYTTRPRAERAELQPAFSGQITPAWLRQPDWMPTHLAQPWETDMGMHGCRREVLEARGNEHSVAFVGPIVYCSRCACFTLKRLGSRLKGICARPAGRAAAAVAYRLGRLRAGRHPITGQALRVENFL